MAFVNYTASNLAQGLLNAGIGASATTVVLQTGQGGLFPSTFPFLAVIEKYDGQSRVTQREMVKVTNRSGDTLTVVRSAGSVPAAYNSTAQGTTAFAFDSGDALTHIVSAEQVDDIQDELIRLETAKVSKSWGAMSGTLLLSSGANMASASTLDLSTATWNSIYVTGTNSITSFGIVQSWAEFTLTFDSTATIVHNATTLRIPGSANIVTAQGDVAVLQSRGSGNWSVKSYTKYNGKAIVAGTDIHVMTEKTTLSASDEFIIYDASSWLNKRVTHRNLFSVFGNGSDGNLSISSGTTTLTRDMYYNDLTISWTAILNPNGYKVFVKWTLSITGGKIQRNGNAGSNGGNATSSASGWGWAGGVALNAWSLNADVGWSAWGAGANAGPWTPWTAGFSANPSYTTISGATGGVSWYIGGATAGWVGWTSTRWILYNAVNRIEYVLSQFVSGASFVAPSTLQYKWSSGSGGGGGWYWPSSGSYSGGGGWAGWNWGTIWISANTFNNFWGIIEAIWGNGGAGWIGYGGSGNWGGGGGGWNWGVFILIYGTLTALWTVTLTGWTWGAWWATPVAGTAWGNGNAGTTISIQVTNP